MHGLTVTHCFDLVHSDVWRITLIISHSRYKYFVTFIDDHSRFTWIYFLRAKSEVFDVFKKFFTYVKNHFSASIKTFRSDSVGVYVSHQFQNILQQKGIILQGTCPHTP